MAWAKLEGHASSTPETLNIEGAEKLRESLLNPPTPKSQRSEMEELAELNALIYAGAPEKMPRRIGSAKPGTLGDLAAMDAAVHRPSEIADQPN